MCKSKTPCFFADRSMAVVSTKMVIKYTVLVVLILVIVALALRVYGMQQTTPSSMQQVADFPEKTQAFVDNTIAYAKAHPQPGNFGQRIQPSQGAQPPVSTGSVAVSLVPPQNPQLAMRQMASFSAPDGSKVLEESIATKRVALAKPLPPPAARSNAPGAGTVEQAQKEYVQSMSQDPSAIQVVQKEWETKAFHKRNGATNGVYQLLLDEARASGALPDPALHLDCTGILLINLPQGHPCLKPFQEALISETPAIWVRPNA